MRTLNDVNHDIAALGRPICPGVVGILDPAVFARWKGERDAWRTANPTAEERYCLLLEEAESIEDAMLRSQRARVVARTSGVPPRTLAALSALKRLPLVESAEAWLGGSRAWLVLGGSVGTGKSVAAAHALTTAIARGKTGAWISATSFATVVGGFSGVAEAERFKHVDVMVLDDFGTEHLTSFTESVFFEVLAARHENGNRTIVTHNLDKPVLRQRLGSRLADRVAGSCTYIECAGESLRGKS